MMDEQPAGLQAAVLVAGALGRQQRFVTGFPAAAVQVAGKHRQPIGRLAIDRGEQVGPVVAGSKQQVQVAAGIGKGDCARGFGEWLGRLTGIGPL